MTEIRLSDAAALCERAAARLPAGLVFVDGALDRGDAEEVEYTHPGDGSSLGRCRLGSPALIDTAVESAARAWRSWWASDPAARREVLLAVAAAIRAATADLGALVSLEMGMPVKTAIAAAAQAAEWFSFYAGLTDKLTGDSPRVGPPGRVLDYVERVPHGVVGAIIPWNGPVMAAALKVAPALAAGNAVVLKPSELAPFSTVELARIACRAGLPAGLLNVVGSGAAGGARLAQHPEVGLVSFTGGNTAGAAVATAAAARNARAVLELGGKSASLVFDDADIARTARLSLLLGAVQNSGQGCFLPTRVLVQRGVYDEFLAAMAAAAGGIRIGDPFAADTQMGPVVNAAAKARITGVVAAASGRLVTGGGTPAGLSDGSYLEPTVLADVAPDSALAQEEVFGPVVAVLPFADEDEAVELANGTRYGLAGYVWTENLRRAHRIASRLEAGNITVNGMSALPPALAFNGWKASGLGVEGGQAGLAEFQRTKNVYVQL
ncbi:aldehyde dehydrogenase family protein [Amycolatopsis rhabdoformis]|uniref:Aldehyde dehydrogenase family protein n=1 Tax=Amycolatopsis rhabdoformis TaxID=1448059 RepID=A0ABZ1IF48_9PSEU|nr:aldehyde dehydrogenase family protein [Amycolatopsis rhabdoformis]WSE32552.1 aldehyde dehydrogenase family protein [Amycolatopsis rhabdoformis]